MNKAQEKAVNRFRKRLQDEIDSANEHCKSEGTFEVLYKFEVEATEYGCLWISADSEFPNAKGTLLSALHDNHWFVQVGKRGKLTAFQYPKSMEQFAGSTYCRIIHIKPRNKS